MQGRGGKASLCSGPCDCSREWGGGPWGYTLCQVLKGDVASGTRTGPLPSSVHPPAGPEGSLKPEPSHPARGSNGQVSEEGGARLCVSN